MEINSNFKKIVIVITITVLLVGGYVYFQNSKKSSGLNNISTKPDESSVKKENSSMKWPVGNLYGDYKLTANDDDVLLMRSGRIIAKQSEMIDVYELYKDPTDENSMYVNVFYDAFASVDYSDLNIKVSFVWMGDDFFSMEYDSMTGEILYQDRSLEEVMIKDELRYYTAVYANGAKILFDAKTHERIDLPSGMILSFGQAARLDSEDPYRFDNYIFTEKLDKDDNVESVYILDNNFEPILSYDAKDIYEIDNNHFIVTKKNDKIGIIDINGTAKTNFEYAGIDQIENYIILVKNKKIGIMNEKFELINDFEIPAYDSFVFLRPCCAEPHLGYKVTNGNLELWTFKYGKQMLEVHVYIINRHGEIVDYYVENEY